MLNMTKSGLFVCLAVGIAAAPALLLAASSPETSVLAKLEDFHANAVKASVSASDLASLSHTENSGWESQADQWITLKASINDMGRQLFELESLRGSAIPAERDAIDHAAHHLKQMADNAEAAIKVFNDNHATLWRPDYQKYVGNVAEESARLSTSVGQFIRLEDLRAREKQIENMIGPEAVD
jgi:hypothetical protein